MATISRASGRNRWTMEYRLLTGERRQVTARASSAKDARRVLLYYLAGQISGAVEYLLEQAVGCRVVRRRR